MVTDEMPHHEYPNFEPLDSMETSWGEHPIPCTQPAGYLFTEASKTNKY